MRGPDPIKVGNFMFIIFPLCMLLTFAVSTCALEIDDRSPMLSAGDAS